MKELNTEITKKVLTEKQFGTLVEKIRSSWPVVRNNKGQPVKNEKLEKELSELKPTDVKILSIGEETIVVEAGKWGVHKIRS